MRLTKLELHGFKSFADRTEIHFEDGVTAIVGPNGCGKSNVSDAVRWVLGEQRARLLRGAKMDEVIFQGSSSRRPVNVAEVSLFFDNESGGFGVPYREVVITRRLSRSGESDYLLNRTPCRLRDIQDLLRGTGLGSDAGVVIEQKMIDLLLSDRPDDRRELFEEAAGVSLYRDRRRTTERRLEETTVDLQRLDDLLSEVQTGVRSLARQRRKAERHGELTSRRFGVELTLAQREMAAWSEELVRLEERVTALRGELPGTESAVARAEQARETAHQERAAAEGRRAELARLVGEQAQELAKLEQELAVATERQRNAEVRRTRAEEERKQGETIGSQLTSERQQAEDDRLRTERELDAARAALAERVSAEDAARRSAVDSRAALERAEREVRELRDQSRRIELDREGAGREQEELAGRVDALIAEREQMAETLELARAELEIAAGAVEEARGDAESASERLATARAEAEEARARDAYVRAELFRTEELITSLQGKVSALETLERERVGLAPAAARLLRDRERFGDGAVLGPLSDFISTGSESALLIEKFLGATVHAIVVRDGEVAERIREWHTGSNPGPLLLLPLDATGAAAEEVEALAGNVEAAPTVRGWVATLLGNVKPLDGGQAFVDARGAMWLPGTPGGPGPLRRRAELSALRTDLQASEEARRTISTQAEGARAQLEESERQVAAASEAASGAAGAVRHAEEQRAEVERRCTRLEREVSNLDASAERLATRRGELSERISALDSRLEEIGGGITRISTEIDTARAQATDMDRVLEAARDERTRCQVDQAQIEARLEFVTERARRLSREAETAAARLDALLRELGELSEADGALAKRMAEWQIELEGSRASLQDGRAMLDTAERAVKSADEALEAAEHSLDAAHRTFSSRSEELHQVELRLTELSGRRTAIRGRLEAEWRRPLEEMLASLVPVEVDDETLQSEMAALRQELETIGPVNPLAIEEHEEELKRFDFLTQQRNDLASAKASLQQAIREIDVTARQLFLATFTQVRENFRQIFMTLFGGGECDLRLENPEAPLDCDIEIHASPRGKRTQRIHLLSSGERALVACSLLFGIFLTKPSPFCLLDEVDAPLDDQNVGRFVRMLNEFKQKTQFIVITHNPRTTTEAADAVYGVTMQEPGVSSFVSVRMSGRAVEEAIAEPVTA